MDSVRKQMKIRERTIQKRMKGQSCHGISYRTVIIITCKALKGQRRSTKKKVVTDNSEWGQHEEHHLLIS